jgi:hypothetical protein
MGEYTALFAYLGVTVVVFIGGLFWVKYRITIKRRLKLRFYHESSSSDHHDRGHNAVGA